MLIMVFIYKEQASPALPGDLPAIPLTPQSKREKLGEKEWGALRREVGVGKAHGMGTLGHQGSGRIQEGPLSLNRPTRDPGVIHTTAVS